MECKNCDEKNSEKCVPFFDVQNTMMHYNWANRRMLIALVCVCLSMIIVVIVFGSLSGGQDSVPAPRAALFNSFAFLVAAVCLHEIFLDGNNRAIPGDRVGGTSRPCRNRRYEFYSNAPT